MNNAEPLTKEQAQKTFRSYVTGFISSLILTLIPYFLITKHLFTPDFQVTIIIIFAMLQLIVQLVFFLHMREESKPRLNLVIFLSFFGIILVVVVASIWIMQHLNYNMSLVQLNTVMQNGEGF
ncbi:MAG TPA: cytochrome o ubiquinol oxidase subunit IV [Candidatus Saccharimonadales bacterium]|nr:cytochrome o ubiquinol oxidase subunit IV [Candidatus Saccharimonadales bacterium]